jgi:hypothetical protein
LLRRRELAALIGLQLRQDGGFELLRVALVRVGKIGQLILTDAKLFRQSLGQIAYHHAKVTASDLSLPLQMFNDSVGHVDRDGKSQPDVAAGRTGDRGIDPDDIPVEIGQAPPLFPGLMEASVWMKLSYGPSPMTRPFAETIPVVTVPSKPKGLPMAMTASPTCSFSESPKASTGRFCALIFRRTTSLLAISPSSPPRLVAFFVL